MDGDPKTTFRPAAPGGIPVIRQLADRIWREHYPGIISREQIEYMLERMYGPEVIRDEMAQQGYCYVVVSRASEAVGFIAYRFDQPGRDVKVSKLYLLPSLHGRGIGRQMLEHVREAAVRSGARTIHLFVNRKNEKALRAYERFGFRRAAEVVTEIGGGFVMDDYRMELTL